MMNKFLTILCVALAMTFVIGTSGCTSSYSKDYRAYVEAEAARPHPEKKPLFKLTAHEGQPITGIASLEVYAPDSADSRLLAISAPLAQEPMGLQIAKMLVGGAVGLAGPAAQVLMAVQQKQLAVEQSRNQTALGLAQSANNLAAQQSTNTAFTGFGNNLSNTAAAGFTANGTIAASGFSAVSGVAAAGFNSNTQIAQSGFSSNTQISQSGFGSNTQIAQSGFSTANTGFITVGQIARDAVAAVAAKPSLQIVGDGNNVVTGQGNTTQTGTNNRINSSGPCAAGNGGNTSTSPPSTTTPATTTTTTNPTTTTTTTTPNTTTPASTTATTTGGASPCSN